MKIQKQRLYKQVYKIYEKEQSKYVHLHCIILSKKDINKLLNILDKKYKIYPKITYYKEISAFGGWAIEDKNLIKINKLYTITLLLIIHEYTHLICFKKKIKGIHSYKFYQEFKKVILYLENNLKFTIK